MEKSVQSFIQSRKEQINKIHEKQKEAVLTEAGLYEEERVYADEYSVSTPYYDYGEKQYFGKKFVFPEVSEEEYREIEQCIKATRPEPEVNNSAENTLNVIAVIVLVCGILASLICFVTMCFATVTNNYYPYETHTDFNADALSVVFALLLGSISSWAIMRVLSNISISLKILTNGNENR